VTAVVDVQPRFRDEPVQQPGVDQRDDRIVVAGQDQCRLAQPRQERQAAPAHAGEELVQVPDGRPDPVAVVHDRRDPFRIVPRRPAVEIGGHPLQVSAIQVSARGCQVHEH
jgi:hypothetical protein